MNFKIETSKLDLIYLIIAFLVNVPFVVMACLWSYEASHNNLMAVVGPIGAWLLIFVGMLWGSRTIVNNLLGSLKDRDKVIDLIKEENNRLVGIINEHKTRNND